MENIKKTWMFAYFDLWAQLGGFIYMVQIVASLFAKCVNRKLYTRHILQDSYLVQKNDAYACV